MYIPDSAYSYRYTLAMSRLFDSGLVFGTTLGLMALVGDKHSMYMSPDGGQGYVGDSSIVGHQLYLSVMNDTLVRR